MDRDLSVAALFGEPGQGVWFQHSGGTGDDVPRSVAASPDGSVVFTGAFTETTKIGATPFSSSGGTDTFVAKAAPNDGGIVWSRHYGSDLDDNGSSIATDSDGNVYVAGTFSDVMDLGGGSIRSHGQSDAFLLKLNADGDYVWARTIGGPDLDTGASVAVRNNRAVIVGSYRGSMDVGPYQLMANGTADNGYIAEFDVNGDVVWAKSIGGANEDSPTSVAIDTSSNVVVVGRYNGPTNLGGAPISPIGNDDVFVAKYAGDTGAHLFSKGFGSSSFDTVSSVATDSDNGIFVVGSYVTAMDVGGLSPLPGSNSNKLFVLKLDVAGAFVWATSVGNPGRIIPSGCSLSQSGDLAVTGQFCDMVRFGETSLTSVLGCASLDWDIFVLQLAGATGAPQRAIRAGGTGLDVGQGVVQLADGRTIVAGQFQGFAAIGGSASTSLGGNDIFLLELGPWSPSMPR